MLRQPGRHETALYNVGDLVGMLAGVLEAQK